MKNTILIVDDNKYILKNLKITLEMNDFNVLTAENGETALKILSELSNTPDLIISDILMPEMDGYEFFKKLIENPFYCDIPFVFLSAKNAPDEVRYGKILGVDDYITKPFNESDLMAVVKGKVERKNKSDEITAGIKEVLKEIKTESVNKVAEAPDKSTVLLYSIWDDTYGPTLVDFFPKNKTFNLSIEKIAFQLFNASNYIYGNEIINKPEGILIALENIHNKSFVFFNSHPERDQRTGSKQYMLAVISPWINYFQSIKLKSLLFKLTELINRGQNWNMQEYWQKIIKILSESPLGTLSP